MECSSNVFVHLPSFCILMIVYIAAAKTNIGCTFGFGYRLASYGDPSVTACQGPRVSFDANMENNLRVKKKEH